ncbi:hypothetical protein BaRGS_00017965 [Batillaria attramentaria]|uniref:Uncharacterized protein n=1 Tax=Batillaria attramentaria TaxID=370345 RepID=A0ABD0KTZ8_9CAEN
MDKRVKVAALGWSRSGTDIPRGVRSALNAEECLKGTLTALPTPDFGNRRSNTMVHRGWFAIPDGISRNFVSSIERSRKNIAAKCSSQA